MRHLPSLNVFDFVVGIGSIDIVEVDGKGWYSAASGHCGVTAAATGSTDEAGAAMTKLVGAPPFNDRMEYVEVEEAVVKSEVGEAVGNGSGATSIMLSMVEMKEWDELEETNGVCENDETVEEDMVVIEGTAEEDVRY